MRCVIKFAVVLCFVYQHHLISTVVYVDYRRYCDFYTKASDVCIAWDNFCYLYTCVSATMPLFLTDQLIGATADQLSTGIIYWANNLGFALSDRAN